MNREIIDIWQRNSNASFSFLRKLTEAKDPGKIVELQAAHLSNQLAAGDSAKGRTRCSFGHCGNDLLATNLSSRMAAALIALHLVADNKAVGDDKFSFDAWARAVRQVCLFGHFGRIFGNGN